MKMASYHPNASFATPIQQTCNSRDSKRETVETYQGEQFCAPDKESFYHATSIHAEYGSTVPSNTTTDITYVNYHKSFTQENSPVQNRGSSVNEDQNPVTRNLPNTQWSTANASFASNNPPPNAQNIRELPHDLHVGLLCDTVLAFIKNHMTGCSHCGPVLQHRQSARQDTNPGIHPIHIQTDHQARQSGSRAIHLQSDQVQQSSVDSDRSVRSGELKSPSRITEKQSSSVQNHTDNLHHKPEQDNVENMIGGEGQKKRSGDDIDVGKNKTPITIKLECIEKQTHEKQNDQVSSKKFTAEGKKNDDCLQGDDNAENVDHGAGNVDVASASASHHIDENDIADDDDDNETIDLDYEPDILGESGNEDEIGGADDPRDEDYEPKSGKQYQYKYKYKYKYKKSGKYKCEKCGLVTLNSAHLKRHMRCHLRIRPFKCTICSFSTSTGWNLNRHMKSHKKYSELISCPHCSYHGIKQSTVNSHISTEHPGEKNNTATQSDEGKLHICIHCEERFTSTQELRTHSVSMHKGEKWKCDHCDYTTNRYTNARRHQQKHVKKVIKNPSTVDETKKNDSHVANQQWKCDQCDYATNRYSAIKHHKDVHDKLGHKSVTCPTCKCVFLSISYLRKHELQQHGKIPEKYKCTYCDQSFTWEIDLQFHKYLHEQEKPYKCPDCLTTNKSIAGLKRHYFKDHHPEYGRCSAKRTLLCHLCGYHAISKFFLTKHMRSHTGEKPYKCDQCNFASATSFSLTRHKATHKSTNPYHCSECSFITNAQGLLTRHIRVFHGRKDFQYSHPDHNTYICDQCAAVFHRKSAFVTHQRIHSGERPYKCSKCNSSFRDKYVLKKHNLVVHEKCRPHVCQICSFSTTDSWKLRQHVQKKHGVQSGMMSKMLQQQRREDQNAAMTIFGTLQEESTSSNGQESTESSDNQISIDSMETQNMNTTDPIMLNHPSPTWAHYNASSAAMDMIGMTTQAFPSTSTTTYHSM
ncbi:uncharacterized protein LOC102803711 [Saccoglossus kowalevskii]